MKRLEPRKLTDRVLNTNMCLNESSLITSPLDNAACSDNAAVLPIQTIQVVSRF